MELDDEKLSFSKGCRNGDLVICRHHNVFGRHLVNIQRNTGQADRLC